MNGILFLVIVILVWKYWRRVQATPPQASDNSAIEMGVMYQNSRGTFKAMNTPKDNPGYDGPQVERQEMSVEDEAQEYEEIQSNPQRDGQLKAQEYDLPVEPQPQGYLTPVATTANVQGYQVPAECGPTGHEVRQVAIDSHFTMTQSTVYGLKKSPQVPDIMSKNSAYGVTSPVTKPSQSGNENINTSEPTDVVSKNIAYNVATCPDTATKLPET